MEISLARFLRVIISQRSVCEAARVAQSFFSSWRVSPSPRRGRVFTRRTIRATGGFFFRSGPIGHSERLLPSVTSRSIVG